MEAQGEKLLQDLVSQEQGLVAKVEAAKAEAAKIVEQAQAEADSILAKAREQGSKAQQDFSAKAKGEAETARGDVLGTAKADVEKIDSQAKTNTDKAVQLVMERVLP